MPRRNMNIAQQQTFWLNEVLIMAKYDYNVFKACNDKYKGYGRPEMRIKSVDMKNGVCQVLEYGCYGNTVITTESIESLVERYISSTNVFVLPFITNPSKLKQWSGFSKLDLNEQTLNEIDALLVEIREQYADITEGIGAVKRGLTFNLQRKG